MSKNQCMTCRYALTYPRVKIGPDGEEVPTEIMITVCIVRNYTRTLNHFKYRNCRLWEIQEAQQTLEA